MNESRWTLVIGLVLVVAAAVFQVGGIWYWLSRPLPERNEPQFTPKQARMLRKLDALKERRAASQYSIPPEGYVSPNPDLSFAPTDSAAYIEQTTVDRLLKEVRHLKTFMNDHHGTKPRSIQRNMIRQTVQWKIERMKNRLSGDERETLTKWILTQEGVLEGKAESRQQLLRRIEPEPPPVSVESDPLLATQQKQDCPISIDYPTKFDTTSEYETLGLKPDFAHLEIKARSDGSAKFKSTYDLRQRVPGRSPHERSEGNPTPDTVPSHPVIQTLNHNPDSGFIIIGEERSFPASQVRASKPGYYELDGSWFRMLQGTISADRFDGSSVALGYIGDPGDLPDVLQPAGLRISRDHCLVRRLSERIEKRHGKKARFQTAYSLGKNETKRRLVIEYRLEYPDETWPHRWSGFADLTKKKLSIRYVTPIEGQRSLMSDFITDEGVTLLADRNHDGLGDMIYSMDAGVVAGTLLMLNHKVRIYHPQYTTD